MCESVKRSSVLEYVYGLRCKISSFKKYTRPIFRKKRLIFIFDTLLSRRRRKKLPGHVGKYRKEMRNVGRKERRKKNLKRIERDVCAQDCTLATSIKGHKIH